MVPWWTLIIAGVGGILIGAVLAYLVPMMVVMVGRGVG